MAETDGFTGSIPEIYDRYLGPMLFESFARNVAGRFAGFEGALLETAAGTGRVTRALAAAAPGARITATDLAQPMLDRAAALVHAPNVAWRQADAQALPFADASFEAMVCQFGMMFLPDKAAGYREARRVLHPGGRFVFSVWDQIAANDISQVADQTVAGLFPEDPPGFLARGPFGYNDKGAIGAALSAGGFGSVEIETVTLPTPSTSAAEAARGLCLGSPMRTEIEARHPGELERVVEAVTRALAREFGEGPIAGTGQALVITATS